MKNSIERNYFETSLEQNIRSNFPSLDYAIGKDFIATFDGVYSKQFCVDVIKHYNSLDKAGVSYLRSQIPSSPADKKLQTSIEDKSVDFENYTFLNKNEFNFFHQDFGTLFWSVCYPLYADKFAILKSSGSHSIHSVKIQKTSPGEGYHVWHYESSSRVIANRLLAFTLYLNDVEDGGETEFLYLSKRVNPKIGRLAIWPAGFTHTHRGNPPLKGDKYIITGWVEF